MKNTEPMTIRLQEIERLLLAHPEGLTRAQIATKLGVHRSTISRAVERLASVLAVKQFKGRLSLDSHRYAAPVRFTVHEALAMYLGSRLVVQSLDVRNVHAGSALRKLSHVLESTNPELSRHMLHTASHMDLSDSTQGNLTQRNLEIITLAWTNKKKVLIRYYGKALSTHNDIIICPYGVETSPESRNLYVVAWCESPNEIRTFRMDLIEDAKMLEDGFAIPKDFNMHDHFRLAWRVWSSDVIPSDVRIRFSRRVADRIVQTLWHPTQRIVFEEAGAVLWSARISEPAEMVPWIRSWGADAVVIEPLSLRALLGEEMKEAARNYL